MMAPRAIHSLTSPAPRAPMRYGIQPIKKGRMIPRKNPFHPKDDPDRIRQITPAVNPTTIQKLEICQDRRSEETAANKRTREMPIGISVPIHITSAIRFVCFGLYPRKCHLSTPEFPPPFSTVHFHEYYKKRCRSSPGIPCKHYIFNVKNRG